MSKLSFNREQVCTLEAIKNNRDMIFITEPGFGLKEIFKAYIYEKTSNVDSYLIVISANTVETLLEWQFILQEFSPVIITKYSDTFVASSGIYLFINLCLPRSLSCDLFIVDDDNYSKYKFKNITSPSKYVLNYICVDSYSHVLSNIFRERPYNVKPWLKYKLNNVEIQSKELINDDYTITPRIL